MVEFALVALLLFTLSAGAYDYGQAWRTGLVVNEAARTGARVGSAGGSDLAADFNALSGLKASLKSSGKLDDVVRVIVFQSSAADGSGARPSTCKGAAPTGCQVIEGAAFRTDWETLSVVDATGPTGCLKKAVVTAWCPTTRDNNQAVAQYYGVSVQLRHNFLFPIMGSGTDVERTAIMRLEPKVQ